MGVLVTFNTVSIPGKVLLCWLPAYTFFAYSFEHIVVNAFFVPMGLMMGANMTVEDIVFFQFLPVTIGNLLGGLVLTAVPIYILTKPVATV
jgi:formate/nitrite transporter FocA (FNT family)